ncbi:hypothetical protein DID76_02110 [Candidatus Marinamargulisbacteria bacterium SCGC AG-414-C22]|nr:hypothetical protein DID76_02110 [Candidatus Marinamargulisbacteria bacterium SCGC AG-414-C22]
MPERISKGVMNRYYNKRNEEDLNKKRVPPSTFDTKTVTCSLFTGRPGGCKFNVKLNNWPVENVKTPRYLEVYGDPREQGSTDSRELRAEVLDSDELSEMKGRSVRTKLYEIDGLERGGELALHGLKSTYRDGVLDELGTVLSFTEGSINGFSVSTGMSLFFGIVTLVTLLSESAEKENIGLSEKMLYHGVSVLTLAAAARIVYGSYCKQIAPLLKPGIVQPILGSIIGVELERALNGREERGLESYGLASYALGILGATLFTGSCYVLTFKKSPVNSAFCDDNTYRENVIQKVSKFLNEKRDVERRELMADMG